MAEENENSGEKAPQQHFSIQRIYIKDVSFETPNSPAIFTEKWEPEINLDLNTANTRLKDNLFEVVLTLTVTAKGGEKTAYLVEVQQAGIFGIAGFSDKEVGHMLGAYCPGMLFPYAREAISDLVSKGTFPQLVLAPINFDALYAQHVQKQQASEQDVH